MICPECNIDGVVYRMITKSGARFVTERCPRCKKPVDYKHIFLSIRDYNWDSLPLLDDRKSKCIPCDYLGCENEGTERHHYAPREFFNDADKWKVGYLCVYHHKLWHETINKK